MTKHHTRAVIDGHTVVVEWVGKKDDSELSNEELMTRIESKLAALKAEVES